MELFPQLSSDLSTILSWTLLVVAIAAILMVILLQLQSLRQTRLLTDSRLYYELELRELAQKMMATQERWEDANHLVLSGQSRQSNELQYFNPEEIPIFADHGLLAEDLAIEPDLVFVLTPALDEEGPAFDAIADVCMNYGLRAVRADLEQIPGDILRRVVALIARARVVVANISTRNANVYYELGIAHALGKPTILISRTLDTVVFDVAANRVITYRSQEELRVKFEQALRPALHGPSI